MRPLATLLVTAFLLGCAGAPERKTYRDDPEARAHLEKGRALFAKAETAPVPTAALADAAAELGQAVKLVPSPEHRFAHARVALILDPDAKDARDELRSCLEEVPDDARFLALQAFVDAADAWRAQDANALRGAIPEEVEKALSVAAVATAREVRAFVGDEAADCAGIIQRADRVRAGKIVRQASELGSPRAFVDEARIHLTRGPDFDRKKAYELVEKASAATITEDEVGRGLLWGSRRTTRTATRELGEMHAEDGEWKDAVAWYGKAFTAREDLLDAEGVPDRHAIVAFARLGAIEALGLAGAPEKERGKARLELASSVGFMPAAILLARLDPTKRDELLAAARKRLSPGGFAGAGDFAGLESLASTEVENAHNPVMRLEWQRLVFFARAVQKGGACRLDVEKAAHDAVDAAPDNTTFTLARQFRHISGDLPAEELQATMPKSAHLPSWRASTELALATRCLLLDDRAGAERHLGILLDAGAIFSVDDEIAWGALKVLKSRD
jgi:tetratricopeptide (TPR) repeat protein